MDTCNGSAVLSLQCTHRTRGFTGIQAIAIFSRRVTYAYTYSPFEEQNRFLMFLHSLEL